MKSKEPKEPSEQQKQFTKRLRSMLPDGSGRAFAAKVGISYSTLHNYLSEASSPTLENLVLLAKALDVSIEWLATGKRTPVAEVIHGDTEELHRSVRIPFLGKESCFFFDKSLLEGKEDIHHFVAICVTTDVMEPTYGIGDVIIVDTSIKQLKENQLIVLRKGDNYLFKRVQVTAQGYNLLSDNKKYPALSIGENDFNTFDFLGEIGFVINKI